MLKNRKYLLVELSVVFLLLAILVGISIPRFFKAQTTTLLVQCLTEMNTLHDALERYFVDFNAYPPDFDSGQISGFNFVRPDEFSSYMCLTTPNAYLEKIPYDIFQIQPDAPKLKSTPYYFYSGPGTNLISKWKPSNTKWNITSIGPDLTMENSWGYSYDQALKMAYHSSNGITSPGDIYASNRGVINPLR